MHLIVNVIMDYSVVWFFTKNTVVLYNATPILEEIATPQEIGRH